MDSDSTSTRRQERQSEAPPAPASPFKRWEKSRRLGAEAAEPPGAARPERRPDSATPPEADPSGPILEPLDGETEVVLPPGSKRPAVLQTAAWVYRPIEFMEQNRRRYGRCFRVRLGPLRNVIFLSDPALVKAVLTGSPGLLSTGDINGIFRPIIGSHSILVLDGAEHMEQRRLLLPPFHGRSLDGFRAAMEGAAEREVATWPTGKPFSALSRMHDISTEIVLDAVLGIRGGERLERLRELLPRFLDNCQSPAFLMPFLRHELGGRSSWGRLMRSVRELDDELFDEIKDRREEMRGEQAPGPDVLSLLVQARHEDGSPMGDQELRDELLTLLVAGHETTSGALALAIEEIVRHPEVMERIRGEIREGGESYVTGVVSEGLRRRPVLPIVGRKLSQQARLGPYVLPRGTVLMPCAYLLHHEEDLYPEPDKFRPERFLDRNPGTYTWLPFGGGIRRCVGANFALMQMRVVLQAIFANLELRAAGPPEPVRRRSVSLAPARGAEVVAEAAPI